MKICDVIDLIETDDRYMVIVIVGLPIITLTVSHSHERHCLFAQQTSALLTQVHSSGSSLMTRDQADDREVRKVLRRKPTTESAAGDEEQDTVTGVCVCSLFFVWLLHLLATGSTKASYYSTFFLSEV